MTMGIESDGDLAWKSSDQLCGGLAAVVGFLEEEPELAGGDLVLIDVIGREPDLVGRGFRGWPSSLPMVKVPPGTKTIVAPSRSPTITRGQPELWMPASVLAVNPWGRGRSIAGAFVLTVRELRPWPAARAGLVSARRDWRAGSVWRCPGLAWAGRRRPGAGPAVGLRLSRRLGLDGGPIQEQGQVLVRPVEGLLGLGGGLGSLVDLDDILEQLDGLLGVLPALALSLRPVEHGVGLAVEVALGQRRAEARAGIVVGRISIASGS